jgi:uncharacterized protein YjbJ (UPF0337 family)
MRSWVLFFNQIPLGLRLATMPDSRPRSRQVQYKKVMHLMNPDQLAGQWKQLKGQIRQKWGKLTDQDLEQIAGRHEQFIGRLQERYGITKEEAQRRVEEFLKGLPVETHHR